MTLRGISRWNARALFAGVLFLGLLAMTARTPTDPDLWWHLRTGQWMVENKQIPHTDSFSFTRSGEPWIAHEWLSEIVFYELWRGAGWAGLIAFSSLVTTAGFMLLYLRCPGRPPWAAAVTVLGAVGAAPAWGVRPQMFAFLLASISLWLLERGWERPRLLLWMPPLFLLWLNLHAGFELGPALLVAYAAGLLWEVAMGDSAWGDVRKYVGQLMLVVLACMALVPLNPSGAKLYRYPVDVLRSAAMQSLIVEWFSPNFHLGRFGAFLLILLALFFVVAGARSKPKARVMFLLLGTMVAGLDAVRHISIFVLVAMPVLAAALPAAATGWGGLQKRHAAVGRLRFAFNVAVLLLLAGFAATRWTLLARSQPRAEAEFFPKAAVEFLSTHSGPNRLFAYYDWGGYAIWKLYPKYHVFVDGRADLYGEQVLREFQTESTLGAGWCRILDGREVQTVLMPRTSALAQALALRPDWQVTYQDANAILLQRLEAEGRR